jgi:hypothetical protein
MDGGERLSPGGERKECLWQTGQVQVASGNRSRGVQGSCYVSSCPACLTHRTLIADAHITAIRKLLLPVLPHMLFAPPGPPLPANHPSPSLLAKLYLHVASLYTSASGLLRSHTDPPRKGKSVESVEGVEGEVIPELKRYLRKESALASALAHKWLGVDAGENGKGQKVGEAVAWVKEAQSRLEELEDGKVREKMKGLSFGKGSEKKKEERKARQGRVERELVDIAAWVRAYTRMNDTVSFCAGPR